MNYAEIAVTLPVYGRFHYAVPDGLELLVGHRVLVPFGGRHVTGFVVALSDTIEPSVAAKAKPILERLDIEPLVPADVLQLAAFAADYYLAPLGEVLKLALPPGLTAASTRRWALTASGQAFLAEPSLRLPNRKKLTMAQKRLLEAAQATPQEASLSVAGPLEEAGFLARQDNIHTSDTDDTVEQWSRAADPKVAWSLLRRSRARLQLWALLEQPQTAEALRLHLGPRFRALLKPLVEQGLITCARVPASATEIVTPQVELPQLTPEQAAALIPISQAIENRSKDAFLLHGVTGSGKTEVYLRAIAQALALGWGALVLVPEIALTPQLEDRFRARFGDQVVVLHSAMADGERRKRWQRLRRGDAQIALGARSALWAPVQRLGIVVVDEEHDPSFKQGSDVRYHGRDLALTRARHTESVALLGSATPSLESTQLAKLGRLKGLRLSNRVGQRPMPTVQIVDLVEEKRQTGQIRLLSRALADRLRAVLLAGQQAILFLNRRGFNTVVFCADCGDARGCRRCDVSLTHHFENRTLACHHCGHTEPYDAPCPKCGGKAMEPFGAGTERIAQAVIEEAPDARVVRLDRDVTQKTGSAETVLATFRSGEANVLVGTQMVAKGHDFPNVTLVGIILADASLAFPDFRSAERTFQLLTQVAGRAGRAEHPGHVVIQTFQPTHYAITAAVTHDTDAFFVRESADRKDLSYPPFSRAGLIRIESKNEAQGHAVAQEIAQKAHHYPDLRVLGPAPAPIARVKDRYRFMVLCFAPSPARLVASLGRLKAEIDPPHGAHVIFDIDPLDLL